MSWVRGGHCCRCGACCKGDPWDDAENIAKHGERPRAAVEPGMCPLYELRDGPEQFRGFCTGHTGVVPDGQENSYYLGACVNWPTSPDEIADKPDCTYTFTWVDD